MTDFDFTTIVNREGTGNLKEHLTADDIKAAGMTAFNAAEMDFKTAPSVIDSMKKCVENGLFGFTLCDDAYREAVCWWMKTQRHREIRPEWIVPVQGTIFSVATMIRMTVGPDDYMIIQPPIYNRYEQAADRLGRKTVLSELRLAEDGTYSMDFDDLEHKMADPAGKLLILCNPHNPIGKVWSKADLEHIAQLAVKYDVKVLSDEIFADYTFRDAEAELYCMVNGGVNNGVSLTGLGKTFNFTGVNHANAIIADKELRERFICQRNSDHYGSLDPVTRAAVFGAYCPEGAAWKDAAAELIWKNYQKISKFFAEQLPMVKVTPLEGGYVIWLDFRQLGLSGSELCDFLQHEALLVLDPGNDYCITEDGFARMNIATPEWMLDKALDNLKKAAEARKWIK